MRQITRSHDKDCNRFTTSRFNFTFNWLYPGAGPLWYTHTECNITEDCMFKTNHPHASGSVWIDILGNWKILQINLFSTFPQQDLVKWLPLYPGFWHYVCLNVFDIFSLNTWMKDHALWKGYTVTIRTWSNMYYLSVF